jgi:copper chaperone
LRTEPGISREFMHRINPSIIKLNREKSMAEFTLHVDGMHCGSCVRRVTLALNSTEGVQVEEVRIGAARLKSDQEPAPVAAAIAALAKAGYQAHLDQ